MPLPPVDAHRPGNGDLAKTPATTFVSGPGPGPYVNEPDYSHDTTYSPSGAWTLPVSHQPPQQISFAYPITPVPTLPYVAPPHQQPISEINNLPGSDQSGLNDLGFATLDAWFGQDQENGDATGSGGLDLQDFWMQVGPGEVRRSRSELTLSGSRRLPVPLVVKMHVTVSSVSRQRCASRHARCYCPP
jgi:hypothetical protein